MFAGPRECKRVANTYKNRIGENMEAKMNVSSHKTSVFKKKVCQKKQAGVAAVEFAIVLPVLLLIIFAIVELGIALYDKAVITNASREGARAGIVLKSPKPTATDIQTV